MDTIKTIFAWLRGQSVVVKILALVAAVLVAVAALFFTGCSSIRSTIPSITSNQIGAEGVIQKEKNVQKQTKWFFKPEDSSSLTSNID